MSAVKGKLLSCKGLKNVDLIGKSDPFVQITLENAAGEVKGSAKSANKTDDLDPVWDDENFNFACSDDDILEYQLRMKVWDTGLGPDVQLGEALIPVKLMPLIQDGTPPQVYTFSLGVKNGKKPLGTITCQLGVVPKAGWFG